MRPRCVHAALAVVLASCGGGGNGSKPPPPLASLAPTQAAQLSPGNLDKQDEDPSILVARGGDALFAAWYSNRAGFHPNGRERKEIFVIRSTDGTAWTDPPVQITDSPGWSFYPALSQGADGVFHLTWMRWTLVPDACLPVEAGQPCPVGTICCNDYVSRTQYSRSADGLTWDPANEVTISFGSKDEHASILAASDGRLRVYFDATGITTTKDVFVAVHDGTGWDPPQLVTSVSSATEHDTFPHVVERAPGAFLMTWTRHAGPDPNPLSTVAGASSATMLSTSSDGLSWTAPVAAGGPSPSTVDVFPFLHPDHARQSWSVLWVTQNGTVTVPVDAPDPANVTTLNVPVGGYTVRLAPTPTPGVSWAVWAEDVSHDGKTQKIKHRFLAR